MNNPMTLKAAVPFIALVLSGCAGTPQAIIGPIAPNPVTEYGQSGYTQSLAADYPLRPSDTISVTVFREPELSADRLLVNSDGMVSLPLVGPVKVAGLTPTALAKTFEAKLAVAYLVDPHVSVNIVDYGSHQVTLEGSVKKPGIYQFRPGTRLSGAIALAEGTSRVARSSQIAVFRPATEGMTVAKFDLGAMQQGTMIDPVILPGDRVVIGTSALSQAWQDFLSAIPLFALFTRI